MSPRATEMVLRLLEVGVCCTCTSGSRSRQPHESNWCFGSPPCPATCLPSRTVRLCGTMSNVSFRVLGIFKLWSGMNVGGHVA